MKIGAKIKEQRNKMGLSLRDLAGKVDLTASFLSQIERDQASPSIDSLRKISQALNVPVFYFLLEQEGPSAVVRKDQRRQLTLPDANITYQLLTPNVERKMGVILAELNPHDGEVPLVHYQHTEECIFVIEGKLDITLGNKVHHLEEGDTVYFDGPMLQRLQAQGNKMVKYLSIMTPPIF
ncbi:MAG: XRE family transcriptional regulator [Chloroflexi bacterium]|nr:MAG: XRE family transcriptional regulator [Chloroflexota bacterium]